MHSSPAISEIKKNFSALTEECLTVLLIKTVSKKIIIQHHNNSLLLLSSFIFSYVAVQD